MSTMLTLFSPIVVSLLVCLLQLNDATEYCHNDEFTAECADGYVILMTSAKYGRMAIGRCVQTDYGFIGCYRDVIAYAHERCSGRQSCAIQVPDATLEMTNPCPEEFKSYLNVSYDCVKDAAVAGHSKRGEFPEIWQGLQLKKKTLTLTAGNELFSEVPVCQDDQSTCQSGQCIPRSYICDGDNDCGDMSDEVDCGGTCRPGLFKCRTSGRCITDRFACDGDNDCGDMSDEQNCGDFVCPEGRVKCGNGNRCITERFVCDGGNDCGDNSDEQNCDICPVGRVKCASSTRCIIERFLCDGDNDCGDMSDEQNCGDRVCPEGRVKCGNSNRCISESFLCDGDNDCGDHSDEQNCVIASGGKRIATQEQKRKTRRLFKTFR